MKVIFVVVVKCAIEKYIKNYINPEYDFIKNVSLEV